LNILPQHDMLVGLHTDTNTSRLHAIMQSTMIKLFYATQKVVGLYRI